MCSVCSVTCMLYRHTHQESTVGCGFFSWLYTFKEWTSFFCHGMEWPLEAAAIPHNKKKGAQSECVILPAWPANVQLNYNLPGFDREISTLIKTMEEIEKDILEKVDYGVYFNLYYCPDFTRSVLLNFCVGFCGWISLPMLNRFVILLTWVVFRTSIGFVSNPPYVMSWCIKSVGRYISYSCGS